MKIILTVDAPDDCGDFDYTISYDKYSKKIWVNPGHVSLKYNGINLIPDKITANLKVEK